MTNTVSWEPLMRERTPRPAKRDESPSGRNDGAYLEYGSLTDSKSRSWRAASTQGATRPVWQRLLTALALAAVPMSVLVALSLWRNASDGSELSPAQLEERLVADEKDCDAAARVQSSAGLRRDPAVRDRCLVERGWVLDPTGEPTECVGSCLVRAVDPS